MTLEKEESNKLEKYFTTNMKLGLLLLGVVIVVFLFKKMKVEYVS